MYADLYARLWELHETSKTDELRNLYGKQLLMLNLDPTARADASVATRTRDLWNASKD